MQCYAATFFVLALIAGAFGLSDTPAVADAVAWFWFSAFLAMSVVSLWRWRSDRSTKGH